eukprot:3696433-Pleurochrysis_carterae.AAC.2
MSSTGAGLAAGLAAPTRWLLRPCSGSSASSAPATPISASFLSNASPSPRKTRNALASQRRRFFLHRGPSRWRACARARNKLLMHGKEAHA